MPNVAVEALVMFVIKAKAGTHAVSCHIVALAWETCQQEEEEAGEEKKKEHFVSFYLLGKKSNFMATNLKHHLQTCNDDSMRMRPDSTF